MGYRIYSNAEKRSITVIKDMPDGDVSVVCSIDVPEVCDFQAIYNGTIQKYQGRNTVIGNGDGCISIDSKPSYA